MSAASRLSKAPTAFRDRQRPGGGVGYRQSTVRAALALTLASVGARSCLVESRAPRDVGNLDVRRCPYKELKMRSLSTVAR